MRRLGYAECSFGMKIASRHFTLFGFGESMELHVSDFSQPPSTLLDRDFSFCPSQVQAGCLLDHDTFSMYCPKHAPTGKKRKDPAPARAPSDAASPASPDKRQRRHAQPAVKKARDVVPEDAECALCLRAGGHMRRVEGLTLHETCALWAPNVYEDRAGQFCNVRKEVKRGSKIVRPPFATATARARSSRG